MKIASFIILLMISFGLNAQVMKIDTENSSIHWVGKKITGQHDGTLDFSGGTLVFDGKKLTGGNFTVDMTTISATDVEGKTKEKLDGHLKADDFFGVDKHPTAKLEFKKIADKGKGVYTVTADMTIKGITKPVTFDITVKENSATTKFNVDRTKFDIKYGSKSFFEGIGDKAINDEFELDVKLVF